MLSNDLNSAPNNDFTEEKEMTEIQLTRYDIISNNKSDISHVAKIENENFLKITSEIISLHNEYLTKSNEMLNNLEEKRDS